MSHPATPALGPGQPLRGDRIHRYVTAFCPQCHEENPPDSPASLDTVARLAGYLAQRDDQIWLERACPTHGMISTLYEQDPQILRYLERWSAPTKQHIPDRVGNWLPLPAAFAQGLPALHTQHTCILLQDITSVCNLACPTCFTSSSPKASGVASLADVLANVDTRLQREGNRLDVLMLSGGEPTLHPQLPQLLEELACRPIVRILLNTNGIMLARDDALLELLQRHRHRVEVYLQYDGVSAASSVHHRGGDLRRLKDAALARLTQARVFTTLTMTAALGVNDTEIGAVVLQALDSDYVGGVSIQPQFGSGRSGPIDPRQRLTHTGVLARLEEQTGGRVSWRDLTALPCSHPHCASVGYMIKDDAGVTRSMVSLIGPERLADWLETEPELLANRMADTELPRHLRTVVKQSLLGLLSEQSSLSHPRVGELWQGVCTSCDLGVGTLATLAAGHLPGQAERLRHLLAQRVTRISVKPFMDITTMLEERLMQCCVHVGTLGADGAHQCAPFCAVQAWPALGAQRLSLANREHQETLATPTVLLGDGDER